jgi:hypothetical protein
MKINNLKEAIRAAIDKVLSENAPAPAKPTEKPGPAVAPGKPDEKKEPIRRNPGNPNIPKKSPTPAKAQGKVMNEEEMLQKIVARFKSKK